MSVVVSATLLRGAYLLEIAGRDTQCFSKWSVDRQIVDKKTELFGELVIVVCKLAIMVGKMVIMAPWIGNYHFHR